MAEGNRKIVLVASAGGHLTEMAELMECFDGYETHLFTYSQKDPKASPNRHFFPNFAANPFAFIAVAVKMAVLFLKIRPGVVFSTGSELAIPAFVIGKLFFRTKLIYLECSAQVRTPSLTGRVVYPLTDLFIVQWEKLLTAYGPKARYVGGLI